MPRVAITIPCFNEERRLDLGELSRLASAPSLGLVMVDDGSTDGTRGKLEELAGGCAGRVEVLALETNSGKAEAVRRGLLRSIEAGAEVVGYADADLSTPVDELLRLFAERDARGARLLMGARVQLLGTDIRRNPARHYLGRVFATGASLALGLPVYDTQCGAKALLVTRELKAALARPFKTGWAFDVELIGRLLSSGYRAEDVVELPLKTWVDVKGSKVRPAAALHAFVSLVRVGVEVRRSR